MNQQLSVCRLEMPDKSEMIGNLTRLLSVAATGIASRVGSVMWYINLSGSWGSNRRPAGMVPSWLVKFPCVVFVVANSVTGFGVQSIWYLGIQDPEDPANGCHMDVIPSARL